MAILRKATNSISNNLTEFEKSQGIDLKLNSDNDLELNNINDFNLSFGLRNLAQALKIRLFTELGSNLLHPQIGTDLQIGEKIVDALNLQGQVVRSLSQDPRVESAKASVEVDGNTVFVNATVRVANTGQDVPLQFVVER